MPLFELSSTWIGLLEVFATLMSGIIAVIITIYVQNRNEKIKMKSDVFMKLMAHKGAKQFSKEYIEAMNNIIVVYKDDSEVIKKLKEFHDLVYNKLPSEDTTILEKIDKIVDEIAMEMAKVLKFKNLDDDDIKMHYIPRWMDEDVNLERDLKRHVNYVNLNHLKRLREEEEEHRQEAALSIKEQAPKPPEKP